MKVWVVASGVVLVVLVGLCHAVHDGNVHGNVPVRGPSAQGARTYEEGAGSPATSLHREMEQDDIGAYARIHLLGTKPARCGTCPPLGPASWLWYFPDPLRPLPPELRGFGAWALHELFQPIKCGVCKCFLNVVKDEIAELLGPAFPVVDPTEQTNNIHQTKVETAVKSVLQYICMVFGPPPFSNVCLYLTMSHPALEEIKSGVLLGERIDSICSRMGLCSGAPPDDNIFVKTPTPQDQDIMQRIQAKESPKGLYVLIEGANFKPHSYAVKEEVTQQITKLCEVLHDYPSREVVVEGHIDPVEEYRDADVGQEEDLSFKRAEAIRNEILKCAGNEVYAVGMGGTTPMVQGKSAHDRKLNRRVEIYIQHRLSDVSVHANDRLPWDLNAADFHVNFFLERLGPYLRDIIEPMKCTACRCLMGFVLDRLTVELNANNLTELSMRTAIDWTCEELRAPPFDILCWTLHEETDIIMEEVVQQQSPKGLCKRLQMCLEDGVRPGPGSLEHGYEVKFEQEYHEHRYVARNEKWRCPCRDGFDVPPVLRSGILSAVQVGADTDLPPCPC